jgi:hypothetical protein
MTQNVTVKSLMENFQDQSQNHFLIFFLEEATTLTQDVSSFKILSFSKIPRLFFSRLLRVGNAYLNVQPFKTVYCRFKQ